jgi:hypothetical protein
VFQAKLALGAPLGHIAYGGRHKGTLPKSYRIVSALAVLVYSFFTNVVIMASVENYNAYSKGFVDNVLWVMLVFFGLGTIANAISPSKPERWWAAYTLTAAICTAVLLN